MVKGAAGQAIQNMNIIFGLDEKTGLVIVPPAFWKVESGLIIPRHKLYGE